MKLLYFLLFSFTTLSIFGQSYEFLFHNSDGRHSHSCLDNGEVISIFHTDFDREKFKHFPVKFLSYNTGYFNEEEGFSRTRKYSFNTCDIGTGGLFSYDFGYPSLFGLIPGAEIEFDAWDYVLDENNKTIVLEEGKILFLNGEDDLFLVTVDSPAVVRKLDNYSADFLRGLDGGVYLLSNEQLLEYKDDSIRVLGDFDIPFPYSTDKWVLNASENRYYQYNDDSDQILALGFDSKYNYSVSSYNVMSDITDFVPTGTSIYYISSDNAIYVYDKFTNETLPIFSSLPEVKMKEIAIAEDGLFISADLKSAGVINHPIYFLIKENETFDPLRVDLSIANLDINLTFKEVLTFNYAAKYDMLLSFDVTNHGDQVVNEFQLDFNLFDFYAVGYHPYHSLLIDEKINPGETKNISIDREIKTLIGNRTVRFSIPGAHNMLNIAQNKTTTKDVLLNMDNIAFEEFITFPNPFDDILFIEGLGGKPSTIKLTDINGKEIFTSRIPQEGLFSIHTEALESGLYLIVVFDGQNKVVGRRKIVKM